MTRLHVDHIALAALCKHYHVAKLALFGSVLKGQDTSASDLDLVIEFEAGKTPGVRFFDLEDALTSLFGRQVDLNTPKFLSPSFRDRVLSEAQVLYRATGQCS